MLVEIIVPPKAGGKAFYRLREEITYLGITVHQDFVTDGGTIPRILHGLFPPVDSWMLGAVIHDFLIETTGDYDIANNKLHEALIDLNVPKWRRFFIMAGVKANALLKRFT